MTDNQYMAHVWLSRMWDKEVRESSDEVIIMTDDGSYGEKGVVTVGMEK